MATDYDEPRVKAEDQPANESLEAIQVQRSATSQAPTIDVDEGEITDAFDLPGEILDEELIISVIPARADEFTCMSCVLVKHRTQLAREKNGYEYCAECEG
ncbi:DUF4193 domain-containing protein [Arthrobacter sp. CAN_C5]|uniref:DUF4193 domain-containing protein n=1 Tax=Arthrobacter sp. CAN_C5 TaxID=2760706 RepID=UPI001AEACEB5|nr:DUF4193 domain-containing protein [Arthrobacter sp. CAN_C5]MBP2216051.1 hypothetical protein [Arthrobacter sp. CAN_C5]